MGLNWRRGISEGEEDGAMIILMEGGLEVVSRVDEVPILTRMRMDKNNQT